MKNELNEILVELRELLPVIREKYQVDSMEIFGSYVRNEQTSGSDLDLLVTFNKTPGLLKYIELKNYLSDQLHLNVDLVMRDALKPRLNQNILSSSISI